MIRPAIGSAVLLCVLIFSAHTVAQCDASPAPAAGEIRIPGRDGVTLPECVSCPSPHYTKDAAKAKLEGVVILDVIVGEDGTPQTIRIVKGIGKGLDQSAMLTVRKWRFKPAVDATGKPVAVKMPVSVTFRLQ